MIGKDDQGDAIPRAGGDKVAYLLAHRGKPVRLLSVIQHVLGAHAVGEIHRQDEVPAALVVNDRGLLPLGAAQGQYQGAPAEHHAPQGLPRLGLEQGKTSVNEPVFSLAPLHGRQAEAHQQRQGEGEGKPGPGEDHRVPSGEGAPRLLVGNRGALTQRRPQAR